MPQTARAYLQLMRPANVVTAAADIAAGYAAAKQALQPAAELWWLLAAGMCLYAGGVVFNDYFDRELDAVERPERPIPSGRATPGNAALLGAGLLAGGIGAAAMASATSALLAIMIAAAALIYNRFGKHHTLLGPLNMGACRGLNLLLGASAVPGRLHDVWFLALLPIAYIGAITAVSRGEVHGGSRATGQLALFLLGGVLLAFPLLAIAGEMQFWLLPFLLLLAWRVLPPFWRAYQEPDPGHIRTAIKSGVLGLIVLDATIAAGYSGFGFGILVLTLLYISLLLARFFAVT